MHRRDVLRTGARALALATVPAVAGLSGEVSGRTGDFSPLGSVPVAKAREAVVGESGDTVYVAATDGFAVVDVSEPATPRVIAERRGLLSDRPNGPLDGIHDAKVAGDRLLVVGPAGSADGDLEAALLFDISDPANPRETGVYEGDGLIHNGFLAEGVAFLCVVDEETNPLVMIDAGTTTELGRWSLPAHDPRWAEVPAGVRPIHDVSVHEGLAYVALWDAGTWVLDVSNPADPSVVTSVGGRPWEVLVNSEIDTGVAFTELPGNHHQAVPNSEGTLLGVGKEAWDDPETGRKGGPAGITLWDTTEIDSPRRLATISPPPTPDPTRSGVWTHAHNFDFAGDSLYTSWNRGGVTVYDVSEPANPSEVVAWRDSSGDGFFTGMRASFWAVQAAPGPFFVASTWADHDGNGDARLFTFPDPTVNARTTEGPGSRPESDRSAETGTRTGNGSTASGSQGEAATAVDAPGFGAVAGLVGAGVGLGLVAASRRARRRREEE